MIVTPVRSSKIAILKQYFKDAIKYFEIISMFLNKNMTSNIFLLAILKREYGLLQLNNVKC